MHVLRPQFRIEEQRALEFAGRRGFGVIVAADANGPRASHVPFVLVEREGRDASRDNVSTWLYEAVHLSGVAHLRGHDENRGHGDALLAAAESRLPKQPGNLGQMEPGKRESMLAAIRVVDLVVDQIEGQAKLNQHKSDADHVAVASQLVRSEESGHRRLAQKMRALRPGLAYDAS